MAAATRGQEQRRCGHEQQRRSGWKGNDVAVSGLDDGARSGADVESGGDSTEKMTGAAICEVDGELRVWAAKEMARVA
ncbi:netrin receptor UNC5D isoform X2 [Sesbania bispinosa]|nr:netrin receptor UNC5D isoform X2 [Sesbania bispinosa]